MEQTSFESQVEDAAEKAGGILRSRYGIWALGAISFIESALVVPLITDPFLVAYILADKAAVWRGVIVTTITSLLGGLFAYTLAFWFYEFFVIGHLHGDLAENFHIIANEFKEGAFVITLLGAITPVPYTIVALAAGFTEASVFIFLLASLIGRMVRYGLVGWLVYHYGERALAMVRRQLLLTTIACFLLAIAYFFFLH